MFPWCEKKVPGPRCWKFQNAEAKAVWVGQHWGWSCHKQSWLWRFPFPASPIFLSFSLPSGTSQMLAWHLTKRYALCWTNIWCGAPGYSFVTTDICCDQYPNSWCWWPVLAWFWMIFYPAPMFTNVWWSLRWLKHVKTPKKWWLKPQIFAEEISIYTQKKLHPDPQSLGLGWEALPQDLHTIDGQGNSQAGQGLAGWGELKTPASRGSDDSWCVFSDDFGCFFSGNS